MDDIASASRQQKFKHYFAQRNDYQIFVGIPLSEPHAWDQISALEANTLVAADLRSYQIDSIRSWVVAYSGTGEIVDSENLFMPLPPGVNAILSKEAPLPQFSDSDLYHARTLIRIQFGKSPTHPQNPAYYSTSLTNISKYKIRCHSFGAYRKAKDGFKFFTITRTLFSASQFEEWYGVQRGGWIEPGETVSDPSNYGRDCIWVYHCETDQSIKFHVGKQCPPTNILGHFLRLFRH